jgi:uncharacterized membrane protein YiaA
MVVLVVDTPYEKLIREKHCQVGHNTNNAPIIHRCWQQLLFAIGLIMNQ